MLHGRPVMMEMFPVKKDVRMAWVDVGGGTARNLEFFSPAVIRKRFRVRIQISK